VVGNIKDSEVSAMASQFATTISTTSAAFCYNIKLHGVTATAI